MTPYKSDELLREYLGHNDHECRVRITRDGHVYRYGSPVETDRSKDFWAYMGTRNELIALILSGTEAH